MQSFQQGPLPAAADAESGHARAKCWSSAYKNDAKFKVIFEVQ